MYSSKEELLEMTELSPPHTKKVPPKKPKRRNKIHSPPMVSPSHSSEKDVTNIFSVKKAIRTSNYVEEEEHTETISDISDVELAAESQKFEETTEKSSENLSKSETLTVSQSYREKIRQRFNKVKEQATKSRRRISQPVTKEFIKLAVERIKRESEEIDASVEMTRSKFNLRDVRDHRNEAVAFFSCVEVESPENAVDSRSKSKENDDSIEYCQYQLPQNLTFNLEISEKDCFFTPNSNPVDIQKKLDQEEPRYIEDEGLYVPSERFISTRTLNILEQRLLSVDDKKWFNCRGTLDILPNPVIDRCLRPDIIPNIGDCVTYNPPQLESELEEVIIIKENTLDLSFLTLKFDHHALFSVEHVLEHKLREYFGKYSTSVDDNTMQKLRNQLEALKQAKKAKKDVHKEDKTIKEVREEIFRCGKMERENLKSTLKTWKVLKTLRKHQNYSNTNLKLIIKTEKTNAILEKQNQKKLFLSMLQDILEEYRSSFKKKMKDYHKKVQEKDEIASVNSDSDEESLEKLPEKPVYDVDEKMVEYDLRRKFEECFKPPGEPLLTLILTEDNEISENPDNEKELTRRKTVANTKIFLKIFSGKVFICKSKPVWLNDKFVVEFNEAFSVQFTDVPKSLTVEVVEQPKGLLKKKVCQLEITVPPQNVSYLSGKKSEAIFEKDEIVHYKHSAVGSGVKIKNLLQENDLDVDCFGESLEVNTNGCLSYSIGWQNSSDADESYANFTAMDTIDSDILDKYGGVNVTNLAGWLEEKRLDPQDPKNSILYEYLDATRRGGLNGNGGVGNSGKNQYFRLSPFASSLVFCDPIELNRNIRLQYLKLRDQHEIEFDGMVVPSRAKEVPLGPLKDYRKRMAIEEFKEEELDTDNSENRRAAGKRFLKQIYTKIFQKCKGSENNLDYDSVVDERLLNYFEQVIKTSLENFLNWFRWTPSIVLPLPKIYRKSKIEIDIKSAESIQTKVEIKIMSAKSVPLRKRQQEKVRKRNRDGNKRRKKETEDTDSDDENKEDRRSYKNLDDVKPFLNINFEDFSAKTSVGSGANPVWNEAVILPLDHHHTDYLNPTSLTGSISIQLFDLVKKSEEGSNDEVNWLGEVTIPVSALTTGQSSLKGWFKVRMPELLLNYDWQSEEDATKSKTNANIQNTHAQNCYLELKLSVFPLIPHLQPNMEDLPSNDLPYIRDHTMAWNRNFNDTFPDRKFSAFAIDTSGKANCITRYLKPLETPQLKADEFDITADQCARYVSLIPFTDSNQFFQNVWLTSEQLLSFAIGSTIDHAVTLTCFLLALKMEAWLVLGFGIPHGSCAYVLVREYNREAGTPKYFIYDVIYNDKWEMNDPHSPLQKVFCLVNGENVWGNAQKTDNASLLRFDLTRRSDWWPLFDNNINCPTIYVNHRISYPSVENTENLERKIERKLKKKFAKLRPLNRTIWQHRLSELFKNSSKQFEINRMYGRSHTEGVLEIKKTISQYSVNGLAFNSSFTDISSIVKKLKKLNIHIQPPEITEFVLSVYVHTYQGDILSVWIFLGSVLSKSI